MKVQPKTPPDPRPSQQDEPSSAIPDGAETSQTGRGSASKKRKIFAGLCVVILVAGAALAWYFWHGRPDDKTPQKQVSSQPRQAKPATILFNVQHNTDSGVRAELRSLDTGTKKQQVVSGTDQYNVNRVQLADGTIRELISEEKAEGDKGATATFAFRDNGAAPKVIYTKQTNNAANTQSWTVWPAVWNPQGTKAYFFEADNLSQEVRIKTVDLSGKVEDLIAYNRKDGQQGLGQFGGNLTPGAVSRDGKTIYFHKYSCLNCDGPGRPDVITYDTVSKEYKRLFVHPETDVSGAYGYWQPLDEHRFAIFASSRSNMGVETYGAFTSGKDWLYLFDARTGTTQKVAESDAAGNQGLKALQLSRDGKTFYYYTERAVQGELDSSGGTRQEHAYSLATNQINSFDLQSGKSAPIDFGLDGTLTMPLFLASDATGYILAVAPREPSDTPTAPQVIYRAALSMPTQRSPLYESPVEKYLQLQWTGYKL